MTRLAVDIQGVHKAFGATRALSGVDLRVEVGESRALLGRNGAGKSTLIGILAGTVTPDDGTVIVRDDSGLDGGPGANSVACVFQRSTLIPELTVAENISLGDYPTRWGFVNGKAMTERASSVLADWGCEHLADQPVATLAPLHKKVVEVCRALAKGPRILLLDEPTAGLDAGSAAQLFTQIAAARERGVTVLYVSHHLAEVFEVCDSVTILRDGRDVAGGPIGDFTFSGIVDAMSGQQDSPGVAGHAESRTARDLQPPSSIVLEAHDVVIDDRVRGVDLSVRSGECVGMTGLDGAGHIAFARAIFGDLPITSGTIMTGDTILGTGDVLAAIRAGVGTVPEDRHVDGLVPMLSVEENATLSIIDRLRSRAGLIDASRRRQRFNDLSSTWEIRCSGPTQEVDELSGGNQQKVVLARALASDPRVLVVINPTAGVDLTAKSSIYASLDAVRESGTAVIVVSSDDDDLSICNRVLVMHKGAVSAELAAGYRERELVAAIQGTMPGADSAGLTTEEIASE